MEEQIATAPTRMAAPLNGKSFSELRRAELKMDFIRQLMESGLARASAERMAAETYPER
ncbi:MAG: hypothetical protein JO303_09075 [Caulobacteraceae bacterium]|nr:hypothetical protein [Caulobacteraceae bacterium]